jgi:hypothetical protein
MQMLMLVLGLMLAPAPKPTVHSISDISQQFTFYMDGRFHTQYLQDAGKDVRNWGTLSKLDLSNANLLLLTGGNHRIPYDEGACQNIDAFLQSGGTVLMMADGGSVPQPGAAVMKPYGATLLNVNAAAPLRGVGSLQDATVTFRRGRVLELDDHWTPLVVDSKERPVLARRSVGAGHLLLGSRGLFGQKPDASDPINAEWVGPLLVQTASTKPIDPDKKHRRTWAEQNHALGPLIIEYHEGTAQFADGIVEVYQQVRPHLVAITGVEPSPGMVKHLLVLPTGGGGFSSGARIAIGAWWGNFPQHRYPMVELIAHEAGHSWVLPYAEPLWNEPIATYLGILVGRRLQMPEADQTLERQIAKARTLDPNFDVINPLADDAPRDLIWGKSYYVFEELEVRYGPGAMARYFEAKRATLEPGRAAYTMDDCVAIWSIAVGEDLFPWFQSLAFDVSRSRTDLGQEISSQ